MGARELLAELAGAGVSVQAEGERLVIRPASKLTGAMRSALIEAKPEVLALLTASHPYRLASVQADAAHAEPWDEAACARFAARVSLFLRRGIDATDADDLAERLHLRDLQGDERALCVECGHFRPGRCVNHRSAGLHSPDVGRDLAGLLQRCPGFEPVR